MHDLTTALGPGDSYFWVDYKNVFNMVMKNVRKSIWEQISFPKTLFFFSKLGVYKTFGPTFLLNP